MSGNIFPTLTLKVNGKTYQGFKTIDIKKSIEDLSGSFTLTMSGNFNDLNLPIIKPQMSCSLSIDSQTVITGFVDRVSPMIKGDDHLVTIVGRDKAADLIDCSVVNSSGQYINQSLMQIVTSICQPFGIKVTLDPSVKDVQAPFPIFAVEQGMSAFEAIQKICKIRSVLATSDGNGGILITRAGSSEVKSAIAEKINLLEGTGDNDFSNRFSIYYCKGQQQGSNTTAIESITGGVGQANDSQVTRYRPLLIIAEGQATAADCQNRARWEASTRIGRSQRYTVTVNSWQDPLAGDLWTVNELVTLDSPTLGVYDTLLIVSVNYRLDEKGQLTTMELTPANAYLTFAIDTTYAAINAYLNTES